MIRRSVALRGLLLFAGATASALPAQDWTDDQLVAQAKAFDTESLPERLQQVGALLAHQGEAMNAMIARIHGDHREYLLKIDRLIGELSNPRWHVREAAERTLIEVGARADAILRQHAEKGDSLEESMRCRRILDAILAKGRTEEIRQTQILRGLVTTAFYLPSDPRMLRALRSALGHTDPTVVDATIRALGAHGSADEADAVFQMIDWKSGTYRQVALMALARMPNPRALELCSGLFRDGKLSRGEACAMLRGLRHRDDAAALLAELQTNADRVVAAGAAVQMPPPTGRRATLRLTLPDAARTPLEGTFADVVGDGRLLGGAIPGLPSALVSFAECDILDFPEHVATPTTDVRVFLIQGSLVTGKLVRVDRDSVQLQSPVFGALTIPRTDVQGIAVDPSLDRLVGASTDHDRVRLLTNEFVEGTIATVADGKVDIEVIGGGHRQLALADVAGLLTVRPRNIEPDATIYTRVDLAGGDRIIGFLVGSTTSHLALSAPMLGAAVVPIEQVLHLEVGVGGGALWGFTLIADYSDNRVVEVDDQGRVVFQLDDVFGAWDAECLDNGNLLITEFSVSRVQEIDRKKHVVWMFDELKNPYDADRLPNGNTLIADTFAGRVIEVSPAKQIVWKYDKDIRPFDCDRLANGNTLIADVLKDRVIEVSPAGEIVWQVTGMNNVHDADRLPNGNTLITLRSKGSVIEVDRDGKTVWELNGLSSPSDADRLPNGHTLVAENTQVREFDRRKNVVWRKEMTWAVEVNRY